MVNIVGLLLQFVLLCVAPVGRIVVYVDQNKQSIKKHSRNTKIVGWVMKSTKARLALGLKYVQPIWLKINIFFSQMKICLAFFRTQTNEIMSI